MIKTVLAGALTAVGAAIGVPVTAHADEFIDYLERNGEDSSTADIRDAELDLGYAICNLYRTTQSNSAVVRSC